LDKAWAPGVDPFYPHTMNYELAPSFSDFPRYYDPDPTTYLHFLTIPAWDVLLQDDMHDLIAGTPGIAWGFAAVPESSTLMMVVVFGWYRRRCA
jgi:hypothetical protein